MKKQEVCMVSIIVVQLMLRRFYILYSCWLGGWIKILLLPQSLVWLLGFGANHSLLFMFIVQYWGHHIETRKMVWMQFQTSLNTQ